MVLPGWIIQAVESRVENKVQLITYPDSLGGNLTALRKLLEGELRDVFQGGVHILPPFPSTGDRGFAPITYRDIEPAFGTWVDIIKISQTYDVMLDVMVNHISRHSSYFQDFIKRGRKSPYADMFITLDKVWPKGEPSPDDVKKIFLRKPGHPFLDVEIEESGETERVWASFGPRVDYSEQIDLDVDSPKTRQFLRDLFRFFSEQNIKMIRLDAIGYVIKNAGTSCFMVEPEIYEFIDWLTTTAGEFNLKVLPEVHAHFTTQFKLANRGYWVYDFILPLLILYTLENKDPQKLLDYLAKCPRKQITMLDCHDGIPVQPDLDDILTTDESKKVIDLCLDRGANLNRILSESKRKKDFDTHQINITYYEALGKNDDAYIAARAIQFFAPGVPQVYYVGLLAGENNLQSVEALGEGRAINRKNYSDLEISEALQKDVVRRLLRLIRFRNSHPAFDGELTVLERDNNEIIIRWEKGSQFCELKLSFGNYLSKIRFSNNSGKIVHYVV